MRKLFIKLQGILADATTVFQQPLATLWTAVLTVPGLLRTRRGRVLLVLTFFAILTALGYEGFRSRIHACLNADCIVRTPQTHDFRFMSEGNATATPSKNSGDYRVASKSGTATVRQIDRQEGTAANRNRYTIEYDVRRFLSTPGTGLEVTDNMGRPHQILMRQRGFRVGTNWCRDLWERYVDPQTGKVQTQMLAERVCFLLNGRPDRIAKTFDYDGEHLTIETKFISDHPGLSAFITNPQRVQIRHSIPGAQKILTLITNDEQVKDDQRGFEGIIFKNLWQNYDKEETEQ